ncbi:hypothetical protein BVRB_022970 [Beta vulgaris subsp. vulgaris]|uniref:Uncharacterized protein n=1 Tax=Beta vulgaris subsp. vulgaris TaxID=3555 RepID=A0A0J8B345_BETVV|nr:hypothetical protein BVRB_022970 [Beta vulgaris subsp. vulgaris]
MQTAKLLRKICSQGVNRHTRLIFSSIAPFCNKFEQCNYDLSEAEYENIPDPYVHQLIQACSNALEEIKVSIYFTLFEFC